MPPRDRLLVYGASGYTARLLLPRLKDLGIDFVVAGRDAARTEEVAAELGVPSRVFPLDEPGAVDRGLEGVGHLLNAAGPFLHTTRPMLAGCLRKQVNYLDLSGEVGPLALTAQAGRAAEDRGLMVLPAIGFDVVPSDCLAVHVARRLPTATRLTLYISLPNLISHGSGVTLAEQIGTGAQTRRDGALEQMRLRMQMRWADFGSGARPMVAVSWGDVVTAYHSTGIPNIEVYFEATAFRLAAMTINQYWGWLLRSSGACDWVRSYASLLPAGPSEQQRARERSVILAEAESGSRRARARLETPEAYSFTVDTAARVLHEVLSGHLRPGFQTPGGLFGPDFVLEFEGVTRTDL